MKCTINGELRELADQATVGDMLNLLHIAGATVVVEVNGTILDNANKEAFVLSAGDRIEVIRFVGGG